MAFHSSKSFDDLRVNDDGMPTHTSEEQVGENHKYNFTYCK